MNKNLGCFVAGYCWLIWWSSSCWWLWHLCCLVVVMSKLPWSSTEGHAGAEGHLSSWRQPTAKLAVKATLRLQMRAWKYGTSLKKWHNPVEVCTPKRLHLPAKCPFCSFHPKWLWEATKYWELLNLLQIKNIPEESWNMFNQQSQDFLRNLR